MAFGIDDGLSAAAAAISLTSTLVEVVNKYRKDKKDQDIELLIEEVRVEALKRIESADTALRDFETMLKNKGIDPGKDLNSIIKATPFFRPFEQRKLKRIRDSLQELGNSVYSAADDISALVRCKDRTQPFGDAVFETAPRKHEFHKAFLNAPSLAAKIDILRAELVNFKKSLTVGESVSAKADK